MRLFRKQKQKVPQNLKKIADVVAQNERRVSLLTQGHAALLFTMSAVLLLFCGFIMAAYFYSAHIVHAQASWLHVRNLTPVKNIPTPSTGTLDKVFVSVGQHVEKGALLASVRMDEVQLDYDETKRDFAEKLVELHCLASLKGNKSTFTLPYDAQLLVDQMTQGHSMDYKVGQCEQELLKNVNLDQALEEMIASLEDQVRVLDRVVNLRSLIEAELDVVHEDADGNFFPFGVDQEALRRAYHDQYFPLMQFAITQQDLREARASYFTRQLEKEEDLSAAIDQTTQEMRYLSRRLRELDEKRKNNNIYASVTGILVGAQTPEVGGEYVAQETVFQLQPLKSEFQIGVVIDSHDVLRFKKGTSTHIALIGEDKTTGTLTAKSAGVFRQPNGTLEALLDLQERDDKNTKAILEAGYKGEGEERIQANVTVGQEKIWHSLRQSVKEIMPFEISL